MSVIYVSNPQGRLWGRRILFDACGIMSQSPSEWYMSQSPSEWYMSQSPQWVIYEPVAPVSDIWASRPSEWYMSQFPSASFTPLFRGVLSASPQTLFQASPLYPQSFNPHNFPHNRPQRTFQPLLNTNSHPTTPNPSELDWTPSTPTQRFYLQFLIISFKNFSSLNQI